MDECICTAYDGRGRSGCGVSCPVHPQDGKCLDCGTAVAEGMRCFPCQNKWYEANRPPTCKQLQRAYSHVIEAFQGLEQYCRLVEMPVWKDRDKRNEANPEINLEEVKQAIRVLRHHWENKIIPWQMSEENRLNWYEE